MTLFSRNDEYSSDIEFNLDAENITNNGNIIEEFVWMEDVSYLEATTRFLLENDININEINKYVPSIIIDKIKKEALDNGLVKPSIIKEYSEITTIDFLFEAE